MTALHPAVADTKAWRKYETDVAELERKQAKVQERLRAAEAEHAEALTRWTRALDAGTAGPRPEYHAPADPGRLQAERLALRSRRTEVLAQVADQAEAALRVREGELLLDAAELVDQLGPILTELVQMLTTMRALSAARGVPSGDSTIPSGLDLAQLVTIAHHRDRLLPTELVPTPEPAPRWTHDDPEAIPDRHYGRADLRGRR